MRVDDFDFHLPEELIALEAVEPRDAARLLHVRAAKGSSDAHLADRIVRDLPEMLRPGDLLVVNDTRVLPAQLTGVRPARAVGGGGEVTVDATLHKRLSSPADARARWRAFVRPAKRLGAGDVIDFGGGVSADVVERDGAEATLAFHLADADFDAALHRIGVPPLPPYIARRRAVTSADTDRYQTVYARTAGSVAAPTAGLHFTQELLDRLEARGVERVAVTLHVGAGTFLPVSVEDTRDHTMHAEWGEVPATVTERIIATKAAGGRVVAVGTTSLRLLESAVDAAGQPVAFTGETDIFITPGFRFRVVDALMTNFHLPRSTLMMLVSAFVGVDATRAAYRHAIASCYRFYSYGDACLFERQP